MPSKKAAVLHGEIEELFKKFLLKSMPLGTVISNNGANPSDYIGGTWHRLPKDMYLVSAGGQATVQGTCGSNNAIVVKHKHDINNGMEDDNYIQAMRRSDDAYLPGGRFVDLGQTHTVDASSGIGYVSISGRKVQLKLAHNHTSNDSGEEGTNKNMPLSYGKVFWERVK